MNKFFISSLLVFCFCVFSPAQDSQTKPADAAGNGDGNKQASTFGETKGLRVLNRPSPPYTDVAKNNNEEGYVTLRVTFLASGEIGTISVVSGLSYGLTEQAIKAAKNIQFEPPMRNGQRYNVVKTVKYSFVIINKEDDKEIKKKAVILEQPKLEYPQGENFKNMSGIVKLDLVLTSFGEVQAKVVYSNLPKEFEDKAKEAATKIKYEPALYKNDVKASVLREIEYEFKPEN